jgi:hypothetical protein
MTFCLGLVTEDWKEILDAGYWIAGYWILDSGYQIVDDKI